MTFYTGDQFPEWKGNLFIGAMAGQHLVRLVLNDNRVVAEEKLLARSEAAHPRSPAGAGRQPLHLPGHRSRPPDAEEVSGRGALAGGDMRAVDISVGTALSLGRGQRRLAPARRRGSERHPGARAARRPGAPSPARPRAAVLLRPGAARPRSRSTAREVVARGGAGRGGAAGHAAPVLQPVGGRRRDAGDLVAALARRSRGSLSAATVA